MMRLDARGITLLVAVNLSTALTMPMVHAASPATAEQAPPDAPARVEVALVGGFEEDPPLFERLRSLFPNSTAVVLRPGVELDAGTVLRPERADTLYLRIRMSTRVRARVYASARDHAAGEARYLFRDVRLESGLDEVGGEILAQVAHSTAEALWRREQETPEQQVVQALESERVPASEAAPSPEPATITTSIQRPSVVDSGVERPKRSGSTPLDVGFGASFATHWSGVEGWMSEPGVFAIAELHERFSLRAAALYLVPGEFDLSPARVRLNGASGELRAGWVYGGQRAPRIRLETGLSVLVARWSSSIAVADARASARSPRSFVRPAALAAGAFEWPLGAAWVAARAELRVPFRRTRYEVLGSSAAASSSALSPGGGLELGIFLDPGGT